MNNDSKTFWLSLFVGLLAAFMLFSYSEEQKKEVKKTYGTLKNVIVARVDIKEMQNIDDTMLEVRQRPSEFLEPNSIDNTDLIVGQVAAAPISKGEQILKSKLLSPGSDTGIALQISPEKRAITLPVDEVRGVAKLIRPGDRIDIFAALTVGRGNESRKEVQRLLKDIVVLATGVQVVNNLPRVLEMDSSGRNIMMQRLSGDTKYTNITIEVTPVEAQMVIYMMATAPSDIFLTLKNPNERDTTPVRLPATSAETLLGPRASIEVLPSLNPLNNNGFRPGTVPGAAPRANNN